MERDSQMLGFERVPQIDQQTEGNQDFVVQTPQSPPEQLSILERILSSETSRGITNTSGENCR